MSSSILPIPGSRSAAKRVMRRQRIQDARAGQAVGVLNFFWEQPEVTKRDVNFLCLVWFMWNTWINCKRNEWSWINCREPEWVFNGNFQALCGVPSGCMATSCKFKSTSRRCSKRSASWTLVSWHVSTRVAVDKCWQSLGLYLWFSIAARCTPKRLLSLWRLGNKEKKRLNVSPVSERLHQKPLMTMVGYLS